MSLTFYIGAYLVTFSYNNNTCILVISVSDKCTEHTYYYTYEVVAIYKNRTGLCIAPHNATLTKNYTFIFGEKKNGNYFYSFSFCKMILFFLFLVVFLLFCNRSTHELKIIYLQAINFYITNTLLTLLLQFFSLFIIV